MRATYPTKRVLSHHGGNRCAFSGYPCDQTVDRPGGGEAVSIGEAAHVRGENPGSARYMKIFCYDLMLARLWSGRSASPGFLIHDSSIFDGVDERQRAEALELAASESQAHGFQYICTLNSDYVPRNEFSSGFQIEDYIRLRLTDADVAGSFANQMEQVTQTAYSRRSPAPFFALGEMAGICQRVSMTLSPPPKLAIQ